MHSQMRKKKPEPVLNTKHMACFALDQWLCFGLNVDMSKLDTPTHSSSNHHLSFRGKNVKNFNIVL